MKGVSGPASEGPLSVLKGLSKMVFFWASKSPYLNYSSFKVVSKGLQGTFGWLFMEAFWKIQSVSFRVGERLYFVLGLKWFWLFSRKPFILILT